MSAVAINPAPRPDPTTVLVRRAAPAVEWIEVEGEVIAWNDEDGELHRLDPIASLVFQLCDGQASLGQTVAELADAFGRDPAAIEQDVLACAEQLCGFGILEQVER